MQEELTLNRSMEFGGPILHLYQSMKEPPFAIWQLNVAVELEYVKQMILFMIGWKRRSLDRERMNRWQCYLTKVLSIAAEYIQSIQVVPIVAHLGTQTRE